ncbi:MAG: hypothetical protein N2167_01555 [Flavobacteriales bacterium]|nr:hypothetical protein [Flavobacteriales bacterium]
MKRILFAIAIIGAVGTLSSCETEVCVKCIKYDYSDTVDFCSSAKSERNDFIVEWIRQDYNCKEVESQ